MRLHHHLGYVIIIIIDIVENDHYESILFIIDNLNEMTLYV